MGFASICIFNKHPCSFWDKLVQWLHFEKYCSKACFNTATKICVLSNSSTRKTIFTKCQHSKVAIAIGKMFVWNPNRSKYCFYYSFCIYIFAFHFTLNGIFVKWLRGTYIQFKMLFHTKMKLNLQRANLKLLKYNQFVIWGFHVSLQLRKFDYGWF